MECLDCKATGIPKGASGVVFLQCEDRKGAFYLCVPCWRKRREEERRAEVERRQRAIEEEEKETKRRKKKDRASRNHMGSSH